MRKFFGYLVLFAAVSPVFALDPELLLKAQEELLEPDKAFALRTRVIDATTLEASWEIAEGYYLYRDKFKFEVTEGTVDLQKPELPAGKVKKDPTFGEVETYIDAVTVRLPLTRKHTGAHKLKLRITSQGCNEPVGVCYPPVIKDVSFDLPQSTSEANEISAIDKGNSATDTTVAKSTIAGNDGEFLAPDEAFKINATADNGSAISVHFNIAEGYYLYRDKTRFTIVDDGDLTPTRKISIDRYQLPKGEIKNDPYFGKLETYPESFSVKLALSGIAAGDVFTLRVNYQGCAEGGICYPPASKNLKLTMPQADGKIEVQQLDDNGRQTRFIAAIVFAFFVGLGLTFTPCVLPMIPILSSVIVEETGATITKLRGGLLATSYVLGTSVTYTAVGVVAGATGDQLQSYFQNIWAISILASIFVLLALSMFGFYHLQMPAFIHDRLHMQTQRMKGGSYIGVFLLGLVSALVVGACVSPLLISALGAAIKSGDPVLGGAIMFSMALGMGVILIALGVGAGFLLPKAGRWMDRVKHFFGVMLIAVAIYLLGTLPAVPVLLLWGALLIITSIYFGATQSIPEGASGWRYFWKGLGTLMLIWGILALVGGMSGNRDIMRPVSLSAMMSGGFVTATRSTGETEDATHLFDRISTVAEMDNRLTAATRSAKPAILDFYADWCTDCLRMESATFSDTRVKKILENNFVLLQVDVTDPNNNNTRAIKKRYGVFGPPAMLFFNADGSRASSHDFYGYKTPDEFLPVLEKMLKSSS